MSWTKEQIVKAAFTNIGMAVYAHDIKAKQYQTALNILDMMIAAWSALNIQIAYPLSDNPDSANINDASNIIDCAVEAAVTNLALRLCIPFGKVQTADLKTIANKAYNSMLTALVQNEEMSFPGTMPRGAGNRLYYDVDRFFENKADPFPPFGEN